METHFITITYQDCATRYELSEADLHSFVELGLLGAGPTNDTIRDEPDQLALLAPCTTSWGSATRALTWCWSCGSACWPSKRSWHTNAPGSISWNTCSATPALCWMPMIGCRTGATVMER